MPPTPPVGFGVVVLERLGHVLLKRLASCSSRSDLPLAERGRGLVGQSPRAARRTSPGSFWRGFELGLGRRRGLDGSRELSRRRRPAGEVRARRRCRRAPAKPRRLHPRPLEERQRLPPSSSSSCRAAHGPLAIRFVELRAVEVARAGPAASRWPRPAPRSCGRTHPPRPRSASATTHAASIGRSSLSFSISCRISVSSFGGSSLTSLPIRGGSSLTCFRNMSTVVSA